MTNRDERWCEEDLHPFCEPPAPRRFWWDAIEAIWTIAAFVVFGLGVALALGYCAEVR